MVGLPGGERLMDPAYLVGAGGALGAVLRYLVGQVVPSTGIPLHTFIVNSVGSFVLGLVVFSSAGDHIVLFVGIGMCGSFTTYSTFSVQTVQLWESTNRFRSIGYALGTLFSSLLAVLAAKGIITMVLG